MSFWNDRYAEPGFKFGTDPAQFLVTHQAYLQRGLTALAVADGEGRNSVFMAEKGMVVTAIDSSDVGVDKARGLAAARGARVNYQVADLQTWNWAPEAFDLVAAVFIQFAEPAFRKKIFDGMKKTLKPGGILLLHGYTPKQLEYGTGGPGVRENLYTRDLLEQDFADMEIRELSAYDRELREGQGHSGMSALIDLVARKI